ncbi:MAG: hypothetical protein ACK41O_26525 [Runella zeae]
MRVSTCVCVCVCVVCSYVCVCVCVCVCDGWIQRQYDVSRRMVDEDGIDVQGIVWHEGYELIFFFVRISSVLCCAVRERK